MAAPSGMASMDERAEALAYIADMTKELAKIARRQQFETLAYLLEMAQLEAENAGSRAGSLRE